MTAEHKRVLTHLIESSRQKHFRCDQTAALAKTI
jgi:hypothetical protein